MSQAADYIQAFAVDRPVVPSQSALVIVDMQYATGHRDGELARRMRAAGTWDIVEWRFARVHDLVIPSMQRLLGHFRDEDLKIIFITLGSALPDFSDAPPHMKKMLSSTGNTLGSPDHEIIAELDRRPNEALLNKTTIGAFASTGLDSLLRAWGCDRLYIGGVSTNMCVETTAREAADRGYAVTLVEDACSTTNPQLHGFTLVNFRRLFGRVMMADEVLSELRGA